MDQKPKDVQINRKQSIASKRGLNKLRAKFSRKNLQENIQKVRRMARLIMRQKNDIIRSGLTQKIPIDIFNFKDKEILRIILSKNSAQRFGNENSFILKFFCQYRDFLDMQKILMPDLMKQVIKQTYFESNNQGEVLFFEGDDTKKFFIILQGQVEILQKFNDTLDTKKGALKHFKHGLKRNITLKKVNLKRPDSDELQQYKQVDIFRAGDSIGSFENFSKKRIFAARCLTDCQFAVLDKEVYNEIQLLYQQQKTRQEINSFQKYSLFENFDFKILESLFRHMKLLTLSKNCQIYKEGDIPKNLYFIKSGKIEITKDQNISVIRKGKKELNRELAQFTTNKGIKQKLYDRHDFNIKLAILTKNQYFGDYEFVQTPQLQKRVQSATILSINCVFYQLPYKIFQILTNQIQDDQKDNFKKIGQKKMNLNEQILTNAFRTTENFLFDKSLKGKQDLTFERFCNQQRMRLSTQYPIIAQKKDNDQIYYSSSCHALKKQLNHKKKLYQFVNAGKFQPFKNKHIRQQKTKKQTIDRRLKRYKDKLALHQSLKNDAATQKFLKTSSQKNLNLTVAAPKNVFKMMKIQKIQMDFISRIKPRKSNDIKEQSKRLLKKLNYNYTKFLITQKQRKIVKKQKNLLFNSTTNQLQVQKLKKYTFKKVMQNSSSQRSIRNKKIKRNKKIIKVQRKQNIKNFKEKAYKTTSKTQPYFFPPQQQNHQNNDKIYDYLNLTLTSLKFTKQSNENNNSIKNETYFPSIDQKSSFYIPQPKMEENINKKKLFNGNSKLVVNY